MPHYFMLPPYAGQKLGDDELFSIFIQVGSRSSGLTQLARHDQHSMSLPRHKMKC